MIAILPERRRNPLRITRESVMRWGKLAAGSYVDPESIFFIQVEFQTEAYYRDQCQQGGGNFRSQEG